MSVDSRTGIPDRRVPHMLLRCPFTRPAHLILGQLRVLIVACGTYTAMINLATRFCEQNLALGPYPSHCACKRTRSRFHTSAAAIKTQRNMWKEGLDRKQQQQPLPLHRPYQYNNNGRPLRLPTPSDRTPIEESVCPTTDGTACTVLDRLEAYERVVIPTRNDEEQKLIAALAQRCYHLPKHTWRQDWLQYFRNNHPVLGILMHYKVHPIKMGLRLLFLLGSLLFGVILTNISWLWLMYYCRVNVNDDENEPMSIKEMNPFRGSNKETIQIAPEMLMLWTIGASLHAVFDNTIWYFSACVCCLNSKQLPKFKCCANYCMGLLIMALAAIATLAVLLRTTFANCAPLDDVVAVEAGEETDPASAILGLVDENGVDPEDCKKFIRLHDAMSYKFLLSYTTEFFLALFIYNPIIGTILFSGCLGCGRIPIIGGRPYEVKAEQGQKVRMQQGHVL
jgi:hypothetical protein